MKRKKVNDYDKIIWDFHEAIYFVMHLPFSFYTLSIAILSCTVKSVMTKQIAGHNAFCFEKII